MQLGGGILDGDHADEPEQDNIDGLPDLIGEGRNQIENDGLNHGHHCQPKLPRFEDVHDKIPICGMVSQVYLCGMVSQVYQHI